MARSSLRSAAVTESTNFRSSLDRPRRLCRERATAESHYLSCFFFFQAEDGIRDYKVTGVQTCALPISPRPRPALRPAHAGDLRHPLQLVAPRGDRRAVLRADPQLPAPFLAADLPVRDRKSVV